MIIKKITISVINIFLFTISLLFSSQAVMAQDTTADSTRSDTTVVSDSISYRELTKSGYDNLPVTGGATSVNAELYSDDLYKNAWLDVDYSSKIFKRYYNLKRELLEKHNLAIGLDYMFLNQFASFSFSDQQATSGIFRIFGSWKLTSNPEKKSEGMFIFKLENRHKIGTGTTPRQLGYEAGSALSTASFKDFGWGISNLYWKQLLNNKMYRIYAGIMDPGDWMDLFPLLNPYKYYLNEAFFNSPATALPNQGIGIAGTVSFENNYYLSLGLHDANGEPDKFILENIKSFFGTREYFKWVEVGYNLSSIIAGETIHLTYWHQDTRESEYLEESWGFNFSASIRLASRYNTFFRAGMSNGNAALMRHLIMIGVGINTKGHDYFGAGLSWGGPNDSSKRNQYGLEMFYALQLTEHLNFTPEAQLTFNPSFNEEKSFVGVYSALRIRFAM